MTTAKMPQHEKIISVFVLIILFAVAAAIIGPQFFYKSPPFSASPATEPVGNSNMERFLAILDVNGFSTGHLAVYDADNLYEAIDGKAPLYTESGFEKLYTEFFQSTPDENLNFKLYLFDMAEAKNAFSVYSQQKRPDAQPVEPANFAYKTENAFFFCRGRYYIELVGSASSDTLSTAMGELAGKIDTALPAEKWNPQELQCLSKGPLVAGSVKFYLGDTFGCSELTDTFLAQYKVDDTAVTVFLSKRPDAKDARQIMDSYCKFLTETDAAEKKINFPIADARIFDSSGSIEAVFVKGNFVAGVHEAGNVEVAAKAAGLLNSIIEAGVKND